MCTDHDHFKGKTAVEHLKDARKKGQKAIHDPHSLEPSGFFMALCDGASDTATLGGGLFLLCSFFPLPLFTLGFFLIIWSLWKMGRSALLGWSRLRKLHRLIEEERWEIEHNREQEREELIAMYAAKGFKGDLLMRSIDVLMADDNRLLNVMLEEELGLKTEHVEHPIRQGVGALVGSGIVTLALMGTSVVFSTTIWPTLAIAFILSLFSMWCKGKSEGGAYSTLLLWHGSFTLLLGSSLFFLLSFLTRLL